MITTRAERGKKEVVLYTNMMEKYTSYAADVILSVYLHWNVDIRVVD